MRKSTHRVGARYLLPFLALIAGAPLLGATPTERPNVLMIVIDDLADYVSILQHHSGIKTPNFDRLAERSVNFTRAYCAAPLCQPSRAAVITGLAPHQTGIYDLGHSMINSPAAMASVGLEEQFKRHGYDTYLTGKFYHSQPTQRAWPEKRMKAAWTEMKEPFSNHEPKLKGGWEAYGPAPGGMESMPDVACLKNTAGWLKEKHDKPFLIVQGINKPHVAFVVPKEFYDMYPLESVVLPEAPVGDIDDIPGNFAESNKSFARFRDNERKWKEMMQAYLATISFCDWVLGQILDDLDASPYAKNTIIVLWSDHGYHIGEKQHFAKRALWTQTSRMPLLVSVPGMANAGKDCAAPVSLLDIFPTLNELCQLDQKVPQKLVGHSLVPLLENPGRDWPHVAVTSHGVGNAAVTDARYHYIRYEDGAEELYDNQKDPREYANLARQPEFAPVVKRLAASLPRSWVAAGGKKGRKKGGSDQ